MAKGDFLVQEDKTTYGGKILEGDPRNTIMGIPVSRAQDSVSSGKHVGTCKIIGSIAQNRVYERKYAGTLHSKSSYPCAAMMIPSHREGACEALPFLILIVCKHLGSYGRFNPALLRRRNALPAGSR